MTKPNPMTYGEFLSASGLKPSPNVFFWWLLSQYGPLRRNGELTAEKPK